MLRLPVLLALAGGLLYAAPGAPNIPAAAQASPHFEVEPATDAWLATFPSQQKAKSDAYFEGGYWLTMWDFLSTIAVMALLLQTGLSARIRDLAERLTRYRLLQSWLYWIGFCTVTAVLLFPWTMYEGFFRERNYGLMNQTFAGWFKDQALGFATVGLLLGGLAFVLLITIVRKLPRSWHIWGTIAAVALVAFVGFIAPVFIAPLFNTYKPLQNAVIKAKILSLARASDISASDVYQVDASRQSKRISAFVSGFGSTERITLNDNLLNRVSPEGVLSVMGHEMGHYVMHHIANGIIFAAIVFAAMFAFLRRAMQWAVERHGERWHIRATSDVAILPFAVIVLTALSFLFTPLGNSFTRTQEYEADLYGINAARQPDGEAEVDVLLGEYRKLDPGPIEEFLFYDHPSGRTRIRAAMRWKAENLCLFDPALPCGATSAAPAVTGVPNVRSLPNATPHR